MHSRQAFETRVVIYQKNRQQAMLFQVLLKRRCTTRINNDIPSCLTFQAEMKRLRLPAVWDKESKIKKAGPAAWQTIHAVWRAGYFSFRSETALDLHVWWVYPAPQGGCSARELQLCCWHITLFCDCLGVLRPPSPPRHSRAPCICAGRSGLNRNRFRGTVFLQTVKSKNYTSVSQNIEKRGGE